MLQSKYLTEKDLANFGFKSLGVNVRVSSDARIYGQENISIGNDVRIDDFVTLSASNGFIEIGDNVLIARGCHLSGPKGIVLKDFSGLAANNVLYSASDDFSGEYLTGQTLPKEYTNLKGGKIVLGKHVNTGSGVFFLGPCNIGEGSCIGGMSFVNKDLDSWGMYFGVPAKRVSERSKKLLALEEDYRAKYTK